LVSCTESTVKGGAMNEYSVAKSRRLAEISAENHLPAIHLVESAGADLPNQSKIFVPGGQAFRDITRASKARVPNVCLVFGSSTAGGAYIPGMSDYVVMVDQGARVFLAGPPLVKMATDEDTDEESLGGAAMHSRVSGVSDYLARDEREAIRLGREIVSQLNLRKAGPGARFEVEAPLYDPEDLLGLVSPYVRVPFDAREVIARVVDGSRFHEFKPEYGTTLVTGWASVHGFPVGILANQGVLFSEAAEKGAQFIQLCNQKDVPILFLQNITGFMVGTQYERRGIIKHGAKLINAVSNSTVPAITIMMGASFGAVASFSTACRYPDYWGRLLLQSGSFAFTDIGRGNRRGPLFDRVVEFVNEYRAAPRAVSQRVFMSCGVYESLIYENRSLVPLLDATGMQVKFVEARDGHNWDNWRDRLRLGLSWLFPGPLMIVYE
jgi:acetyl-CoA carboxylase carboxyltransferase component